MADARDVQRVIVNALEVASLLGIPAVTLGAKGAELLIDLGFDAFLGGASRVLAQRRIAEAAGDAAARSSVATHARMHAAEAVAEICLQYRLDPDISARLVVAARGGH